MLGCALSTKVLLYLEYIDEGVQELKDHRRVDVLARGGHEEDVGCPAYERFRSEAARVTGGGGRGGGRGFIT